MLYPIKFTFHAACKILGLDAHRVLKRANLDSSLLTDEDPQATPEEFFNLFGALALEYDKPGLPLKLGIDFAGNTFASPGLALQNSSTMREGLKRFAKYKALLGPIVMASDSTPDGGSIRCMSALANVPLSSEMALMEYAFVVQSARRFTMTNIRPKAVTLTAPVACISEAEAYFGTPISFGDRTELLMDDADLDRDFTFADPGFLSHVEHYLDSRMHRYAQPETLSDRVGRVVRNELPNSCPTVSSVAAELAMSSRSLQRKLAQEGTSFQEVLDEVRGDLADHYLSQNALSRNEISLLLGFKDISGFYRFLRTHREKPATAPGKKAASG